MFFKINDRFVIKDIDFLKEISTLYDLLIYLLDHVKRVLCSTEVQLNFFKALYALEATISSMKADMTDQSEERKRKIFVEQESVLNNAKVLLEKKGETIK